ncbi:MAG: Na+/H+ antiporter subunit C [Thermococci archaeon]|nr:Na+/H+ antiporter subunit C [Thermococci archaeon]
METAQFMLTYTVVVLFAMMVLGIYGVVTRPNMIKKVIMLNIMGDAINMLFIIIGYRLVYPVFPPVYEKHVGFREFLSGAVDPLPQALVLTAVVIGMAMNILLVTYAIQAHRLYGTTDVRDLADVLGQERREGP